MCVRKFPQWVTVVLLAQFACSSAALAQDRENCLLCHQFPGLSWTDPQSKQVRLLYVDPSYIHHDKGPHARLACTDCHAASEVGVVPHHNTTPVDCARQCHLVRPDAPPRVFSHENVLRMLDQSPHSPTALLKLKLSGEPLLKEGQSICLFCHDEPLFATDSRYSHGVDMSTGRCDVCHTTGLPLETPFFLRHVVGRLQPARPTMELAQVCAVCHSDAKFVAEHDGKDPVASFVRSYHGKAALLGDRETANCVDCHVRPDQNAHLMLGPDQAASAVHVTRLENSCRSTECHPGADKSIAATAVHLDLPSARGTIDFVIAAAFILITFISFAPSALIVLLELGQLVVGRHWHGSLALRRLAEEVAAHPDGRRRLMRFSFVQRVQHWVLGISFTLLAVTGFPMKFAEAAWAEHAIRLLGGLSIARLIHHWAGLALIVGFVVHLTHVAWMVARRAASRDTHGNRVGVLNAALALPMVIRPSDFGRVRNLFAYLFGLRHDRPTFDRFSASEKFEYFGVLWGSTLLGITGLMLWGEQITSHFLGGRAFNIASIVHTYEAFLAVIHVGILHMFNVILAPAVFPLSPAVLNGRTPAAKLAEENGEFVIRVARQVGISTAEAEAAVEVSHG